MKKRIIAVIFVISLCLLAVGLCGDFNVYTDKTKTIPEGEGGILFSITTFDGISECEPFVKCLGHTWLSLENRTGHSVFLKDYEIGDGEELTFSVWALSCHCGVFFNLEANFIEQYQRYAGRQSLCIRVRESCLAAIEAYIDSNDHWTLGRNCSRWCAELWNEIAGEDCSLKTQTLVCTPERLQRSFGEYDCVEYEKDFSAANVIFYYRNGVREELRLCS